MRISDWSSDVCSSDLAATTVLRPACSAAVYRQALSLLIAQRRPSEYLLGGRQALAQLVDSHLRLLAEAGVIDAALRDAALAERARVTDSGFTAATPASPNSWKAAATQPTRPVGQVGLRSVSHPTRLAPHADNPLHPHG